MPAARPESVFQIRRVSKVYKMGDVEVQALRSVDLDLYRGELAVMLGASGSGALDLLFLEFDSGSDELRSEPRFREVLLRIR